MTQESITRNSRVTEGSNLSFAIAGLSHLWQLLWLAPDDDLHGREKDEKECK